MAPNIEISLKRSLIGHPEKQRRVVWALGLRKLNQKKIHQDTPAIRGMIRKVSHLLEVRPQEGEGS
jgi:large subunit ribosomal protein L30